MNNNIIDYGYISENPYPVHRVIDFDKKEVYDYIIVNGNDYRRNLTIDNFLSLTYSQIKLIASEYNFNSEKIKSAINMYWKFFNDGTIEDNSQFFTFKDENDNEIIIDNKTVIVYNYERNCRFKFNNKFLFTRAFAKDFFEEGNY